MKHPPKIRKRNAVIPDIEYQEVILEPEEAQKNLDKAFDVLFEEVARRRKERLAVGKLSTSLLDTYV